MPLTTRTGTLQDLFANHLLTRACDRLLWFPTCILEIKMLRCEETTEIIGEVFFFCKFFKTDMILITDIDINYTRNVSHIIMIIQ